MNTMATNPLGRTAPLLLAVVTATAIGLICCQRDDAVTTPESAQPSAEHNAVDNDSPRTRAYEWVLVYQMSYDNNLAWAGYPILQMMRAGLTSDRVAIALFADLPDEDGLLRVVLEADGLRAERLATDDSASAAVFERNMAWVASELPANHYALTFLDHGGRLDQIGYDEHPGGLDAPRWLNLTEVADVLRTWQREHQSPIDLLFLQQCGKGSIEAYWELSDGARYLMASEVDVDAPNGYYTQVLQTLSSNPEIDGLTLARLIMRYEPPETFGSYAVIDSSALRRSAARLNAVLEPLSSTGSPPRAPEDDPSMQPLDELFHPAADESYVDLVAWLDAVYRSNDLDTESVREFHDWLTTNVLLERRISSVMSESLSESSGITLMLPSTPATLLRYENAAIYRDTLLDEVHRRLID